MNREERNEAFTEQYGDMTIEQCKDEVTRLTKINMDHKENKKAEVKSYNELIKETNQKIEFLVERVDYLAHEAAVAAQLDAAE